MDEYEAVCEGGSLQRPSLPRPIKLIFPISPLPTYPILALASWIDFSLTPIVDIDGKIEYLLELSLPWFAVQTKAETAKSENLSVPAY